MAYTDYKQGLSFPLEIINGKPKYSTLKESVENSVSMILGWPVNNRAYDTIFGSIANYLNWPSIPKNHQFIAIQLRASILSNDNRVEDVIVTINTNDTGDKVFIQALVKIKNSEVMLVTLEL